MSELRRSFEANESLRVTMLTVWTVILALAFLALLVSDQVQAAAS